MKTDNKIIVIPDFFIFLRAVDKYPNKSTTDIQMMTSITYSHLHRMKKLLNTMGMITVQKEGIRTLINITPKGAKVVLKINELLDVLEIDDVDLLEFRKKTKYKHDITDIERPVKKVIKDARNIIRDEEKEISMSPEEFAKIKADSLKQGEHNGGKN